MGRAKLKSTVKATLVVSTSDNYIFYKVPVSGVGMFHSAEVGNKFVVIKFFPKTEEAIFRKEIGDTAVSFT